MDGSERQWITGMVAVRAAVEGGNRTLDRILVQADRLDGATARLQQAARDRAIPLERVPKDALRDLVGTDRHGGVVAEGGPRRFLTLDALLAEPGPAAIFLLDGIEDPYNFGQAVRSLYAAGATGMIVRERSWPAAGEIVMRSSAGASELMPMAMSEDPEAAADFCRAHGLAVMVATPEDAIALEDVDWRVPFVLAIGGEKRGISRGLQKQADVRVVIPYGRAFDAALGAAPAAAVLGFEMRRQRGLTGAGR